MTVMFDGTSFTDARSIVLSTLNNIFTSQQDRGFVLELMSFFDQQLANGVTNTDAIMLNMQSTDAYKQRFAGNQMLAANGFAPLSAQEYLAMEKQYSAMMQTAGLDAFNNRNTFATLIGNNVSPAEMESRITNVFNRINMADQGLVNELAQMTGQTGVVNKTDLATSLLMGKQGVAWLQGKIESAGIAAEATARGLKSSIGAEQLQSLGVTRQQAAQGFETIKQLQPTLQSLGNIYGTDTTDIGSELEKEQFQGMLSQRRRQLTQAEENTFKGSSGIVTGSLAKSTSGQI